MNRITILLLALLAPAVLTQAQPVAPAGRQAAQEPHTESKIGGVVVSAATGEVLKSAHVGLIGSDSSANSGELQIARDALSGGDGRFLFTDLPAGNYVMLITKAGFGARYGPSLSTSIQLGERESRADLVLRLQPAAVVSGRVVDADGKPVRRASVMAMSRGNGRNIPAWQPGVSSMTNDLGEYRLWGLNPGKYVISAVPEREPSPLGVAYTAFGPSFYPAAVSPQEATLLRLNWGMEATSIDFRLPPAPHTTVRGLVVEGSSGKPCRTCQVRIQDDSGIGSETETTPEGLFEIRGVPQGSLWIIAGLAGPSRQLAIERIMVPESRALEVRLVIAANQSVAGEVVLEDPPKEEEEQAEPDADSHAKRQSQMSIRLELAGPANLGLSHEGSASSKGGQFEIQEVVPGAYRVSTGALNGGYLRSISLDGRELEEPKITVRSGSPLSGLQLRVAFDGGTISGRVKAVTRGPNAGDAADSSTSASENVVLFPDAASNPYATRLETGADGQGGFLFQSVPPGSYILFAARTSDAIDVEDPQTRRALEPYLKKVTVAKGEKVTIEVSEVPESAQVW